METFNVLLYDWNSKEVIPYDVIPYFVSRWKVNKSNKKNITDRESFKKWVESNSAYTFWSRCEYEFLIAPWPYNKDKDEMKKIDIHFQIMQNLDILVDLLIDELKLKL